ncbi:hypothetical protein QR680_013756 [Steinernema hermaphroditum]|uniref:Fatty-acid and retinol-binding protein 1 n=1 Tax=Steinernema hermaphroditum TaxID=289476 RepID=A0AA39I862_9BILA|nr:hypothetical protein QR680_013756 [Steinernema hermaphroditum]
MAFKIIVVLATLAIAAYALPIPTQGIEKEVYDVLPEEVKAYVTQLSDADEKIFAEVGDQIKGKDSNQAYEILKTKSPDLAERFKNLYAVLDGKINSLSPVPQKFAKDLVSAVENAKSEPEIKAILQQGENLPKEAKDELLKVFPTLKSILKV